MLGAEANAPRPLLPEGWEAGDCGAHHAGGKRGLGAIK